MTFDEREYDEDIFTDAEIVLQNLHHETLMWQLCKKMAREALD